MSSYVIPCHVMSYHVISYHIMSSYVILCHVMPCHVMPCHVMMLCRVISCNIIIALSFLLPSLYPYSFSSLPSLQLNLIYLTFPAFQFSYPLPYFKSTSSIPTPAIFFQSLLLSNPTYSLFAVLSSLFLFFPPLLVTILPFSSLSFSPLFILLFLPFPSLLSPNLFSIPFPSLPSLVYLYHILTILLLFPSPFSPPFRKCRHDIISFITFFEEALTSQHFHDWHGKRY